MKQSIFSKRNVYFRFLASVVLVFFLVNVVFPVRRTWAQLPGLSVLNLPTPGTMIRPSAVYAPALVCGMVVHPEDPLKFDFIIDGGDSGLSFDSEGFRKESKKLVKYFLAALTVPEKEQWVNLSPYEKDRITGEGLGHTEMGRDMLAQDYILKQLTASLLYPDDSLGKEFWAKVYSEAKSRLGVTDLPLDTFNKVWIMPSKGVVYEKDNKVFVIEQHLQVMLERDYLAMHNEHVVSPDPGLSEDDQAASTIMNEVVRSIVLPAIEREVNTGKNFAQLRQIYNSMILAVWYKKALRDSILGQIYADKNKAAGIDVDPNIRLEIYEQYLASIKSGVYQYIKDEIDPASGNSVPRKYVSGGEVGFQERDLAMASDEQMQKWLLNMQDRLMAAQVAVDLAEAVGTPSKWQSLSVNNVRPVASIAAFNSKEPILGRPTTITELNEPQSFGAGNLGTLKRRLAFWANAGVRSIQLHPLNRAGFPNTPYLTISGLMGDISKIDVNDVIAQYGAERSRVWLNDHQEEIDRLNSLDYADLNRVHQLVREVMSIVWEETTSKEALLAQIEEMIKDVPELEAHAVAYVVRQQNLQEEAKRGVHFTKSVAWHFSKWGVDLKNSESLRRIAQSKRSEVQFELFLELLFRDQMTRLKIEADRLGISLIGDVPISPAEFDGLFHPELFLNANFGVPKDSMYDAQIWQFAAWDLARDDTREYILERVRLYASFYHILRNDNTITNSRMYVNTRYVSLDSLGLLTELKTIQQEGTDQTEAEQKILAERARSFVLDRLKQGAVESPRFPEGYQRHMFDAQEGRLSTDATFHLIQVQPLDRPENRLSEAAVQVALAKHGVQSEWAGIKEVLLTRQWLSIDIDGHIKLAEHRDFYHQEGEILQLLSDVYRGEQKGILLALREGLIVRQGAQHLPYDVQLALDGLNPEAFYYDASRMWEVLFGPDSRALTDQDGLMLGYFVPNPSFIRLITDMMSLGKELNIELVFELLGVIPEEIKAYFSQIGASTFAVALWGLKKWWDVNTRNEFYNASATAVMFAGVFDSPVFRDIYNELSLADKLQFLVEHGEPLDADSGITIFDDGDNLGLVDETVFVSLPGEGLEVLARFESEGILARQAGGLRVARKFSKAEVEAIAGADNFISVWNGLQRTRVEQLSDYVRSAFLNAVTRGESNVLMVDPSVFGALRHNNPNEMSVRNFALRETAQPGLNKGESVLLSDVLKRKRKGQQVDGSNRIMKAAPANGNVNIGFAPLAFEADEFLAGFSDSEKAKEILSQLVAQGFVKMRDGTADYYVDFEQVSLESQLLRQIAGDQDYYRTLGFLRKYAGVPLQFDVVVAGDVTSVTLKLRNPGGFPQEFSLSSVPIEHNVAGSPMVAFSLRLMSEIAQRSDYQIEVVFKDGFKESVNGVAEVLSAENDYNPLMRTYEPMVMESGLRALSGMAFIFGTGNNGSVWHNGEIYTANRALLELGHNIYFNERLQRWVFTGAEMLGDKPLLLNGDYTFEQAFSGTAVARKLWDSQKDSLRTLMEVDTTGSFGIQASEIQGALNVQDSDTEEKKRERALAVDQVLKAGTLLFAQDDIPMREFVTQLGNAIGQALVPLFAQYSNDPWVEHFVMVSGVGENFVRPSNNDDLWLFSIRTAVLNGLQGAGVLQSRAELISQGIVRSGISWQRELAAARLTPQEVSRVRHGKGEGFDPYSVGVSIGGTKIGAAVVLPNGDVDQNYQSEIKWRETGARSADDVLVAIIDQVKASIKDRDLTALSKVGIAFAGPVDSERGIAGTPFKAANLPFDHYQLVGR